MTHSTSHSRETCPGISKPISLDELQPGDEVKLALPSSPEDIDKEVWAIVLDRRSGAGSSEVWVVINNGTVMHRNPSFAENSVKKFGIETIVKHLKRPIQSPLIRILTASEDDTILEIRRVDGKTTPIIVQVDRGDEASVYRVDHTGKENVS